MPFDWLYIDDDPDKLGINGVAVTPADPYPLYEEEVGGIVAPDRRSIGCCEYEFPNRLMGSERSTSGDGAFVWVLLLLLKFIRVSSPARISISCVPTGALLVDANALESRLPVLLDTFELFLRFNPGCSKYDPEASRDA